jgi:Spy/CpxP family protein refolding chaperone
MAARRFADSSPVKENRRMKLIRLFAVLVAFSLVPLAFAQTSSGQDQDQKNDQQQEHRHGGHRGMQGGMGDPDQHLQMLTKQLNLTQEQQEKIRPILQDQHTKMEQLEQNSSTSKEDRRSQMQQMHQDTVSRVKEVLNDDQKAKFDKMQQNMMEHRHGHHGDHADHDNDNSSPHS